MENEEIYMNTQCKDIPPDTLRSFVRTYITGASADMGQSYDREFMPERVYEMIVKNYNHLPLILIASAFKKGALGQFGNGRLVPRTIYGWLAEMNDYLTTQHEIRDNSEDYKYKFDGLEKYPMGKAICKKIDWIESGAITSSQWDRIPLKTVAEIIGSGNEPNLEYFGINSKV
jgi:hypothetical protein